GTYQLHSSTDQEGLVYDTLDNALSCGYRMIGPKQHGYPNAQEALLKTLNDLDCEYLDLYLIHWPGGQKLRREDPSNKLLRTDSWKALKDMKTACQVRSIGVSNYTTSHLEELTKNPEDLPSVLQVEFHPKLFQKDLLGFCRNHNIYLQAYTSLGHGKLLAEPTVLDIARKHHKSPAQVLLRWALQHGVGVIPKSTSLEHMKENIQIYDFSLASEDMDALNGMDTGEHFCWDPTQVA
ncbi:hypothetical protein QZH41_014123, partial [Actinostola sp. cb2023]